MMDYSVNMIARSEHELMTQSLASVPEHGVQTKGDQPGWMAQQAGRLLTAVGNGLVSLGERLKCESDLSLDIPRAGHEGSGLSS